MGVLLGSGTRYLVAHTVDSVGPIMRQIAVGRLDRKDVLSCLSINLPTHLPPYTPYPLYTTLAVFTKWTRFNRKTPPPYMIDKSVPTHLSTYQPTNRPPTYLPYPLYTALALFARETRLNRKASPPHVIDRSGLGVQWKAIIISNVDGVAYVR